MYQVIAKTRIAGEVIEDITIKQSFTIAKKIGLLLSSHDIIVQVYRCDDVTGERIKEIDIWQEW